MPNVPRVDEQQVRPAPLPNVRLSATATEETFGGGASLEKAGALASDLAGTGIKIAIQQKKSADDTVVTEADTRAGIIQAEIEENVKRLKGKDSAGAIDLLKKRWSDDMEGIQKSLSNDEQKSAFQKKNAARFLSSLNIAKTHSITEGERYGQQITDGSIANWGSSAVENFDNPQKINEALYAQIHERVQESMNNGLGRIEGGKIILDAPAKQKVAEDVSKTVAQVYRRKLYAKDVEGADAFRAEQKKFLKDKFDADFSAEDTLSMDHSRTVGLNQVIEQDKKIIVGSQRSNGKRLIDDVIDGRFDDLAELEVMHGAGLKGEASGVDTPSYAFTKAYMKTQPYLDSKQKRLELAFGVPEAFFAIDKDADSAVDNDARYADIVRYRSAALAAYHATAITKLEFDAKIAATDKIFEKGVATSSYRNSQQIYEHYNDWFNQHLAGFKVSVGGQVIKQPLTKPARQEALAFVGNQLMNYVSTHNITDEDIPKVTQMFLGKYIKTKFPELVGKEEVSNAVMDMESNFRNVYSGKSTAKADFIVQYVDLEKVPHDPETERVLVNRKSGAVKVVPK